LPWLAGGNESPLSLDLVQLLVAQPLRRDQADLDLPCLSQTHGAHQHGSQNYWCYQPDAFSRHIDAPSFRPAYNKAKTVPFYNYLILRIIYDLIWSSCWKIFQKIQQDFYQNYFII
jgi:hypothetical protein